MMYRKFGKRLFDIFVSAAALIGLSPLLLLVAVLVRIKLGSPVIFTQERPGLHEKIFQLYKFRTMTDKRSDTGELLPDAERLTKFGRALRTTSLDELPELWNILKGDMSIVGPRPLLVRYLPYYTETEMHRHDVKPGLTGWAQINGRNLLNWDSRLELDVKYVDNVSAIFDIKIMIMTVLKVIKREDIIVRDTNPMLDLNDERCSNENREIPS